MTPAPTITLAGHVLNERFSITDLSRPLPSSRVDTEDVPGRHGVAYRTRTMGPRSVTFRLWSHSTDHRRLVEDATTLAAWLWGAEAGLVELSIDDEAGRVRHVAPDGELPFDEYVERGNMLVTLIQPDPVCDIGDPKNATVPSGGSVTILVGGTHPPRLSISAPSAVRDTSSLVWGLRFDGDDVLRVLTGSDEARAVGIDCGARSVTLAGAVHLVTLESDWPELWPGTHVIEMDEGTGAAAITWQERSI